MVSVERASTGRLLLVLAIAALILVTSSFFVFRNLDVLQKIATITGHQISALGGFVSKAELNVEMPSASWSAVLGSIEGSGSEVLLELGEDPVNYAGLPSLYAFSPDSKRVVVAGLGSLLGFSFDQLGFANPEDFEHLFSLPVLQSLSSSFSDQASFTLNSTEIPLRYLMTNSFGSGPFFYLMLAEYQGSPVFISFEEESSLSFENTTVDYQIILPSGQDYFVRVLGAGNISYEKPSPGDPGAPGGGAGAPPGIILNETTEEDAYEEEESFCYYSCSSWDRSLCEDSNLQFRSCICSCDSCPGSKPLEMADCSQVLDDEVYIDYPREIEEEQLLIDSFSSFFTLGNLLVAVLFSVIVLVVAFELAGRASYERRLVNIFLELKEYYENSIIALKKELADSLYAVLLQVYARMNSKNKKRFYMDVNSLKESLNKLEKKSKQK
ncbi:MAG TPA: hypothetical protein ENN46_04675 [Candidatus Woesearchaeota archaeon]|nr:hypothetical protein [Candidatus Woesearchaeota archaeon]